MTAAGSRPPRHTQPDVALPAAKPADEPATTRFALGGPARRAPAPAGNHCDTAAVTNCDARLGVPHWLRDRHPAVDFDQVLRRRAGITTPPRIRFIDPATRRRTFDQPVGNRPPGRPRKVPEA